MLAYPVAAMKHFFVLFLVSGFGLSSCERHEWHTDEDKGAEPKSTDTINLFLHENHSDGHDGKEGAKDGETPKGDH